MKHHKYITFSSNKNTHKQTHTYTPPPTPPLATSSFVFIFNMEKPNPNPTEESNPTKSPSSSPERPPSPFDYDDVSPETNPTNEGYEGGRVEGETILKTPMQVWEELTAGDDEIADDDGEGDQGDGGDGAQIGGHVAVVTGGSMVVEGLGAGIGSSEGQALKKRKNTQVKDPPSGKPRCPECNKEFLTWKGAFGHMRKHPDRAYRGFFSPPVFGSSAAAPNEGDGGDGSKGEKSMEREVVASLVRGLVFDLNRQMEGAGSPAAERDEAPAPEFTSAEEKNDNEGRKFDFDLNELPSAEDDEDEDK